jgi:hypothetical protein
MKFAIAFAILTSCARSPGPQPDSEASNLIIAGTTGWRSWSLAGETVTFNDCIQDSCYSSHLTVTSCNSQLPSGGGDIEDQRTCYLYSNDDGEYVIVDGNGEPLL